ncbi:ATP-binding cassette domain-containing protein [Pseudooceanicola sp. 502str34]
MSPVLVLDNLSFGWPGAPRGVLDIRSLSLAAGENLFLRGPSGCGKSTLLSAIAGMVNVGPGQIRVAGIDVGTLKGGARDRFRVEHIGMIFQVFNLVPWMSALDNVQLPCRFSAARRARAGGDPGAEAHRLLSALHLPEAAHRAPARTLSIGQQQRVAAARALIGAPELILADEPTSALDEDAKAAFADLLAAECAAAGAALLFVSHDRGLEGRFDRALDFRDLNRGIAP